MKPSSKNIKIFLDNHLDKNVELYKGVLLKIFIFFIILVFYHNCKTRYRLNIVKDD